MRIVLLLHFGLEQVKDEVGELVILRAEPRVVLVGEDGVKHHQALDHATE